MFPVLLIREQVIIQLMIEGRNRYSSELCASSRATSDVGNHDETSGRIAYKVQVKLKKNMIQYFIICLSIPYPFMVLYKVLSF